MQGIKVADQERLEAILRQSLQLRCRAWSTMQGCFRAVAPRFRYYYGPTFTVAVVLLLFFQ